MIKREEWLRVSMKLELCNNRRNGNGLNKSQDWVTQISIKLKCQLKLK